MEKKSSEAAMDMLRFTTVGSVDDGKSSLIGRLLLETDNIYADQLEAIKRVAEKRGGEVDLALLTDGLASEREQGITIDVAYRYFQTEKRKFIIADTPGHIQYTRNMITGASTANLAIILIDAKKGILEQSRRHGFLISLLQVPHLIVAVNKIDLVDYSRELFQAIVEEYNEFSKKLAIKDITYLPLSALRGDNIVKKSENMHWYDGPTLLHVLENVHVSSDINLLDFRFPVQNVIRPDQNFRGYAGKVVSGTIAVGEEIAVLPSGRSSRIKSIVTMGGDLQEAAAPFSPVLTLEDEIDIGRGDMIVRKGNLPQVERHLDAIVCWMDDAPLKVGKNYVLKHTTRSVPAFISRLHYSIDVNTLHRKPAEALHLNDIGRVEVQLTQPIMFDYYEKNRETGSFIIVDPETNFTVGAGMIRGVVSDIEETLKSENVVSGLVNRATNVTREETSVSRSMREERNKHRAAVLWLTGLSGAGKSTIAKRLEHRLFGKGFSTALLDGDNLRHGLCKDLGFSVAERTENIRRVSEVGRVLFDHGAIVICTFISPLRERREQARTLVPAGSFFEIFVHCSLKTCIHRDPKGLYKKAIDGKIPEFTGISAPYEEPLSPEITLNTEETGAEECVDEIVKRLSEDGII